MTQLNKNQLIKQTWQKAQTHSEASKVGIPSSNFDSYQFCPCCDKPIQKVPISLTQHTKEFEIFGFGYSLWFSFLKYCIFLVLVLIASKTTAQLYQATKQNFEFCYGNSNANQHGEAQPFIQKQFNPVPSIPIQHNSHTIHYLHLKSIHIQANLHPQPRIQNAQLQTNQQYLSGDHNQQSTGEHEQPSAKGQHHHQAQCTSFMVYFSLFKQQLLYQGTFPRITQFIIHLIALVAIRNMILKQEQYFDQRTTSLSDYSIIISDLPQVSGNRQRLQKMFDQQFGMTYGNHNSQIKDMIYVFQDQTLNQLSKRKKQLQVQIIRSINEQNYYLSQQQKKQFQLITKQQVHRAEVVRQSILKDRVVASKMIVIFNSQADKAQVIRCYKLNDYNAFSYEEYFKDVIEYNQQNIVFKQAPQPNQIIWEHIGQSDQQRYLLVMKGYAFTFLFLTVITAFFYFILLAKTKLFISAIQMELHDPQSTQAKQFKIFATIIVFIAIFGVVLFNKFVMGLVLHKIVHNQRHAYVDKLSHSFSIKYSLGMFFTTALMTLAVQAITFKNFYSHQFGVIEEETIMFFVTAFLIPLIWFIHPYNLFRKFQFSRNKNKLVTQQKANYLSQNVAYDLGKRYAQVFQIMWFTFLYSQLIPLGSFLILVGLFLYFWVDKYNFLRNSVLKSGMSGKMAILALKSLDATLFLPSAGQILFDSILRQKFDVLALILTLCGICYMFVPVSEIIWYLNSEKFFLQQKTYEEAEYTFKQTYYTQHPVYKLAFEDKIRKYKKRYSDNFVQYYKTQRVYGMGRGTYKKDSASTDMKTSRMTQVPRQSESFRTKLLGSNK